MENNTVPVPLPHVGCVTGADYGRVSSLESSLPKPRGQDDSAGSVPNCCCGDRGADLTVHLASAGDEKSGGE